MLEKYLEDIDDGSRQLVFLDELPWMDTPRSGFMTAFEGFWNTWGCHRDNLMVVVCGSANSWILDNLINYHGGLYNRVTYEIKLKPFTLSECEKFYESKNVRLSRYDIVQSYMILGGIPYYMNYFQSGFSLAQNIDNIMFSKSGKLRDEYNRLFASIFNNPELMKRIVNFLYTRNAGYTRAEIIKKIDMKDGGSLTQSLNALIASDFVVKYVPFGKGKKEYYKLVDPFCMFYLHFMDNQKQIDENFWQHNISSTQVVSWKERYEIEQQLMYAVANGNSHKAEIILQNLSKWHYEQRHPNALRNLKNYLIVSNTVYRMAVSMADVHPIHINGLSSYYACKIENLTSEKECMNLLKEMVRKYCLLVKNHSLKNYSPLIQKVLTHIDFDLTVDLSLKAQAQLWNVNPSYLSNLFKRETGMTLTEYRVKIGTGK